MAKTPSSGMGKQSQYKGMVTGGSSAQTGDYVAGADKHDQKLPSKSGKVVTGTVKTA
jgi:hypothetical protein